MDMQELLFLFKDHLVLLSFLSGFITGETVILTLSFLSANGYFPLVDILVFCTLGMYFSDFIPFMIGRSEFLRKIFSKKFFCKKSETSELIIRHLNKHFFLSLLSAKFIYGAAIPVLGYMGYKKVSYKKFALWNILVEIIFVPTVVAIGWFGGKGYGQVSEIFKDLRIAIFLLIIVIILMYFIKKWLGKKLIEKQKKLD